jgi:Tfp pilus assembly protein PilE
MNPVGTSRRTVWPLVVLGIAAVLAVIAIPNLKLARMTANEASAKSMLHAINTAQERFSAANPSKGYACTLGALADPRLIPESLASGEDKGYLFEIFDCGRGEPNRCLPRVCVSRVEKRNRLLGLLYGSDGSRERQSRKRADCLQQGVAQR